jgi:hypothetical protein
MVSMDFRQRTFANDVADRFRFLTESGFVAMPADAPSDLNRRPLSLRVIYVSPMSRVEVSLDMAFAGEDVVSTHLEAVSGRWEFGPNPARKGHEMRKALAVQAEQLATVLQQIET